MTQERSGKARRAADAGPSRVAFGFRAHSGWAVLVAVGSTTDSPAVFERRRVELADPRIHGSTQLYHAAAEMELREAEKFLKRCEEATRAMARAAVRQTIEGLAGRSRTPAGACVLLSSGRQSPNLAATLASHPLIHTAEGQFFRDALLDACKFCGLTVRGVKERELVSQAITTLGVTVSELDRRIAEMGKIVGPPWRQDEKMCAIAAWLVLANR